ncbi:uncharacterized protein B0P05DRAFT_551887 [Gilbertella persicaria]|uniref:uncharacterized protein n=1 Tax=Gilbertella persicaria TaxID=101096 RepID=UPI00221F8C1F|nr:uncharacterized protein B0P05DRAFT_551887 [Gilbertella persicaria]KAI8068131.1 hypothetical protein B0P05DRAFT_551887 [Gilbertella persicaria]
MKQHLPTEIYQHIFRGVPRWQLYQCMFVCKAWHGLAAQMFYEEIRLSIENIRALKQKLADGSFCLPYGSHVKSFTIVAEFDSEPGIDDRLVPELALEVDELEHFLAYTPHLKKVDFTSSFIQNHYIHIFHTLEQKPLIEEFAYPASTYDSYEGDFFALCYAYRDSLKDVSLTYNYHNHMFHNTPSYLALPEFKHMTHLSFCNDFSPDLLLFDILEMCPQLTYFSFTSYTLVPGTAANALETLLQKYKITQPSPLPHNRYLTYLEIAVPVFTRPYMDYITHYTPFTLNTIRLKIMDDYFYDWIQNEGMDAILQLARRMRHAKTARIFSCPSDDVQKQPILGHAKITQFFQIVHALQGDRTLYCTFNCSESSAQEIALAVYHGYHLSLNYGLDQQDFDGMEEEPQVPPYHLIQWPDRAIAGIGFEIIHEFKLRITHKVQDVPMALMDYALKQCPHLHHYEADFWRSDCKIECHSVYHDQPKTQDIRWIKIKGGSGITQALAHKISTYLPHITTVDYRFGDRGLFDAEQDNNNYQYILDLRPLTSVQEIHVDFRLLVYKVINHVFLKLIEDTSEVYYEIIKRNQETIAIPSDENRVIACCHDRSKLTSLTIFYKKSGIKQVLKNASNTIVFE